MTTTRSDWPIRGVLALVMGAALTVGTWSIYTLLTAQFGAPRPVAVLGCLMFDGSALFFALLAQRYARSPDSGLAPRLAMLATTATSSWVNWQHARLEGWGLVGGVVLAAAPILAELAFEMWHRWQHRADLRARGRVPRALPVLGRWPWLLHPLAAFRVIDTHVRGSLAVTADEAQHSVTRTDPPTSEGESVHLTPQQLRALVTLPPEPVRPALERRSDRPVALPAAPARRVAPKAVPPGATLLPIVSATPAATPLPRRVAPARPATRRTATDDAHLGHAVEEAMRPVAEDLTGVQLLTVADVAALKKVTQGTVRSWVNRGKLQPALRDGNGRVHFHPAAVAALD